MTGLTADFSFFQSIEYSRITALYSGAMQAGDFSNGDSGELLERAGEVTDRLDLGSSKGGLVGADTVMAILEEKVSGRIEARFTVETEGPEAGSEDDYWSPENTAKRIVDFSVKFYDAFAAASGGHSEETLDEFLGIVEGAIDEGFSQARSLLAEYHQGAIPNENDDIMNLTRTKIGDLLAHFREEMMAKLTETTESVKSNGLEVEGSFNELITA